MHVIVFAIQFGEKSPILASGIFIKLSEIIGKASRGGGGGGDALLPGLDKVKKKGLKSFSDLNMGFLLLLPQNCFSNVKAYSRFAIS